MSLVAYNLFYKKELRSASDWGEKWDLFISAYNASERIRVVYDRTKATRKVWILHNEYAFSGSDLPKEETLTAPESNEAPFIRSVIQQVERNTGRQLKDSSICVDITGFMRPHLLFLAMYFERNGVKQFDVIYSEPERYAKKEKTTFSGGAIEVRQIAGYEGLNSPEHSDDLLVIGSGYDDRLIKAVAEKKDKADKIQIFGLPSLRADMYQENVLNAYKASDAIGSNKTTGVDSYFAPANDPFVTASVLSELVAKRELIKPITNLYLSPLATKPQALGFALYYLGECVGKSASMLFPVSSLYAQETSTGIARVWRYTVEYPVR